MIKIEDIVFWILIISVIGVIIWMLSGSPPLENGLLMIAIFITASEILLWKALFAIDKKTSIGFIKVGCDLEKNHFEIKKDLNTIRNLIKK